MSIIQKLAIFIFFLAIATSAHAKDTGTNLTTRSYFLPGTYLVDLLVEVSIFEGDEYVCNPVEAKCDSQSVIQFHQGGTLSEMSELTNFVFGQYSGGDSLRVGTVRLGDWKQVQYNMLKASAIRFASTYGPVSDDPLHFGRTTIIDYTIDLDMVNQTFSGTFESRSYAIDEDPYDSATIPTLTVRGLIVKGAPLFPPER